MIYLSCCLICPALISSAYVSKVLIEGLLFSLNHSFNFGSSWSVWKVNRPSCGFSEVPDMHGPWNKNKMSENGLNFYLRYIKDYLDYRHDIWRTTFQIQHIFLFLISHHAYCWLCWIWVAENQLLNRFLKAQSNLNQLYICSRA